MERNLRDDSSTLKLIQKLLNTSRLKRLVIYFFNYPLSNLLEIMLCLDESREVHEEQLEKTLIE